jgi:hypothetical protein
MIQPRIIGLALLSTGFSFGQNDSILPAKVKDTIIHGFSIPVFAGYATESDMEQQDVSTLLQSSPDVFVQFAGFQFGMGGYRQRGYGARNQLVMLNGINMASPETGFSAWSSWSGLNDVTRYPELRFGNTASAYGFSGPGGYVNMDTKASSLPKGSRLSYIGANRLFRHRGMLTHATGLMQNGWALAVSASTRHGNEVYVPGTFFHSQSFFISADKQLAKKHLLSLSALFTPVEQGRAAAEPLEAYRLSGNNYYNALWGYQNGRVRNTTVSRVTQPVILLTHSYKPDEKSGWDNSVMCTFGKSGLTGLNWNGAPNPRPDYYYYLPSYYYEKGDAAKGDQLTQQWRSDVTLRQVNWDQLIALNQANLYTPPSQLGQAVNTTETRAKYILEERVENKHHLGLNSVYTKRTGNLLINTGANLHVYNNRKYKELKDLLGASYWLDYDQFAQDLGVDPMIQQNDLENPDKKITEGQRIGYDYTLFIRQAEAWMQAEYNFKKLEAYGALSFSGRRVWKESEVANGKFPTSSKGKSKALYFFNHGIKAGATWKLSGRQFISVNGSYQTRAPETNKLFISPTTRNDLVQGITSEYLLSGDINYILQYSALKIRGTYYYTQINNQVWQQSYWSDVYNTFINYLMTDVNENHQGLELGLEKTLFGSHVLQGAFGFGRYVYTNRPNAQAWQDNNNAELFTNRTVYLKNYRVGGSPQVVTGIGYRYNGQRRWFATVNLNYLDGIYIEPNPDRRTAEALVNYTNEEQPAINRIIGQERLAGYYLLNVSGGKSFRIRYRYYVKLNLSVNNLTNNRNSLAGGYEQLRWDASHIDRFANKYVFMTGRTYLAMISLNF